MWFRSWCPSPFVCLVYETKLLLCAQNWKNKLSPRSNTAHGEIKALDEPRDVAPNKWLGGLDQHWGTCLRGLETPGRSIQKGSLPKPSCHLLLSDAACWTCTATMIKCLLCLFFCSLNLFCIEPEVACLYDHKDLATFSVNATLESKLRLLIW